MASVSSLDRDLSRLRSAKYSAKDSDEVKQWFSEVLQSPLPDGKDLMDCLKDGVLLCRLINQVPNTPTLKPKASSMPFVQMEQIAAFINVVSKPPISLPAHDLFLTVDLFEKKDPAQVVQCLTSFSRIANTLSPQNFPTVIGGAKGGMLSPSLAASVAGGRRDLSSGSSVVSGVSGYSTTTSSTSSSSLAPTVVQPMFPPTSPPPAVGFQSAYKKPPPPVVPSKPTNVAVSTWSSKDDEKKSMPAWNIHQYGYMGGASQGNMGVSFGSRRQIVNTTPVAPKVNDEPAKKAETVGKRESFSESEKTEAVRRLREEEKKKEEDLALRRKEKEDKKREEELRWQRLMEEEAKEREREMTRKKLSLQEAEKRMTWQREQEIKREQEFAEQKRQRDAATQRKLDLEKAEREKERARVRELERELELARQREAQYQKEKGMLKKFTPEKQGTKWETPSAPITTPLKAHKTGGTFSPSLNTKKSAPNFSTTTTTKIGGAPALIPQRTGGLVAQLTGEFNKLPSPSVKTLTPGEYPSSGRISPSLLTPHKTGERRALPPQPIPIRSHKTGGDFPKPNPPPRALPSPPNKKPDLPPRDFSSPTKAPIFRNYTTQRTPSLASDFSTASTLRRQNSWENDNETVIDVPTGRNSSLRAAEEAEKAKAYRWANLSFLEKERERERERQREWERNQLEKELKVSNGLGTYRSPLMGPRGPR